jgi:hypothetical protein
MKLLFNTTTTAGSTELKEALGFINADLPIKNLLADLRSATLELIKIIGKEVYDLAINKYGDGTNISPDDKPFIDAVRFPIAINAYRKYAPNNDIAHTNNGRKMLQDDAQKLPFEWMIDRDNKALERKYYGAIDDLIYFLDYSKIEQETNETLYTVWTKSKAFQASHRLFVRTMDDFNEVFPIESRLLFIRLVSGLEDAEENHIKARIGVTKFNELKTKLKENTEITEEADLHLLKLIKRATVFFALAWSMPRLSVQLYPEGVLQYVVSDRATTIGAKPSLKSEPEAARQAFMYDFEKAVQEIETFLLPTPTPEDITLMPNIHTGTNYIST